MFALLDNAAFILLFLSFIVWMEAGMTVWPNSALVVNIEG
jgi:hypothetical protein